MRSNGQSSSQPKKKNQGRRKVDIEKIKNETNLQVSFSKRRIGLFKKASELCTLTGAEVGLVVFSPGNKAHSFGHTSIKTIADRFSASDSPHAHATRSHHVQQTPYEKRDTEYLAMLEKQIEVEKAKKEKFEKTQMSVDLGKLDFQQLKDLRGKMIRFGENLQTQVNEALKPMPYRGMAHHDDDAIPYDHEASEADAHWPAQH